MSEFKPTHRIKRSYGSYTRVQVVSQSHGLATTVQPCNAYWEKPRYTTRVELVSDLLPLEE